MQRNIHFGNILKQIKNLKKDFGSVPLLLKLESDIEQIDNDVKEFFANEELIKELSKLERDPKFVKKFQDEYAALARQIKQLATRVKDVIMQANPEWAKKIENIVDDLLAISGFMPIFQKYTPHQLVDFCKSLGGVSLLLSQSELPTAGAEIDQDGKMQASGGICGGLVLSWAEQSVKNGTPKYPIVSTLVELDKQEENINIRNANYDQGEIVEVNNTDLVDKIDTLQNNYPYLVVLKDPNKKVGHGIGIRKQNNHIEIYDPNCGHFFFRDSICAGSWLSALLREYQKIDFPAIQIQFNKYKDEAQVIPQSNFVTEHMMNLVAFIPHTDAGYRDLVTFYRNEQAGFLTVTDNDKKARLIINSIKYLSFHLSPDDQDSLIEYLTACHACEAYRDEYKTLLSEETFDYLKSEAAIPDLISILQQQKSARNVIPLDVQNMLLKVKMLSIEATKRSSAIVEELIRERSAEKPDYTRISELVLKNEIIKKRQKKLTESDISAKLLASAKQRLSKEFTVADAEKIISDIKIDAIQEISSDEMRPFLNVVAKINYLKEALIALENNLNEKISARNSLDAIRQDKVNAYKRDCIKRKIEALEDLKDKVVDEAPIADIYAEAAKIYSDFERLPAIIMYELDDTLIKDIDSEISNTMPKEKYSESEYKILSNLCGLVSSGTKNSILSALEAELSKGLSLENEDIIKELVRNTNAIRLMLHSTVDPSMPKQYEVSDLIEFVRKLSPSSINQHGDLIAGKAHNFDWHYELPTIPQRLLELLDELADADTNSQAEAFYGQYKAPINFWKTQVENNQINLNAFISNVCNLFKIPLSTKPYDVRLDVIKDALKDIRLAQLDQIKIIKAEQAKEIQSQKGMQAPQIQESQSSQQVLSKRNDRVDDAANQTNERNAFIDKLVEMIYTPSFWSDKVSMFNTKRTPDGILQMREALQEYKQKKSGKTDNDYRQIIKIIKSVADSRRSASDKACFFGISRHHVTESFYYVCSKADKLIDLKNLARFTDASTCVNLKNRFEVHKSKVSKLDLLIRT